MYKVLYDNLEGKFQPLHDNIEIEFLIDSLKITEGSNVSYLYLNKICLIPLDYNSKHSFEILLNKLYSYYIFSVKPMEFRVPKRSRWYKYFKHLKGDAKYLRAMGITNGVVYEQDGEMYLYISDYRTKQLPLFYENYARAMKTPIRDILSEKYYGTPACKYYTVITHGGFEYTGLKIGE